MRCFHDFFIVPLCGTTSEAVDPSSAYGRQHSSAEKAANIGLLTFRTVRSICNKYKFIATHLHTTVEATGCGATATGQANPWHSYNKPGRRMRHTMPQGRKAPGSKQQGGRCHGSKQPETFLLQHTWQTNPSTSVNRGGDYAAPAKP